LEKFGKISNFVSPAKGAKKYAIAIEIFVKSKE
jgi:hypothetical protein